MGLPALLTSGLAAVIVWQALRAAGHAVGLEATPSGSTEARRREQLRGASWSYLAAGPLIRCLATTVESWAPQGVLSTDIMLRRAGVVCGWLGKEWLASTILGSLLFGVLSAAVGAACELPGNVLYFSLAGGGGYAITAVHAMRRKARRRVGAICARLPFVVDAAALMMEAGAGLRDSLAFAARNCEGHPLGDELARCLAAMERGRSTAEALVDMGVRLKVAALSEFTTTAAASVSKGNSVSGTLLAMAVRMRNRRSHEIETRAGRAQIQLYYPGFLLLMVCMAIMTAPFLAPLNAMLNEIAPVKP